ncbi:LCP family protein [Enterocloster clostridioformis]|uniref:LCP family protein n=1 Tax=Enterocloster clostridioformis TaxID=1531 RepID=UPI0007406B50|nr:LCP family protein [Enterocloster clostridioformis]CUX75687.1 Transcriptional regulator LytR [Clostridium sp. C105KSO14]
MNREFDNGFDEEEERLRGRSRKRDLGAGAGADSDTMPGGRAGSSRRGINGAGQEVRAGSGGGARPRTPVFADRAPGRAASDSLGQGPAAGSRSSAGPRSGAGSGQRPRYAGEGAAERAPGMSGKIGTRSAYAGEKMPERPGYAGAGGNNGARSGYTGTGSASGERPVYAAGKSVDRPRFTGDRPDGRPGISGSRPGERPRYTGEGKGARPAAGNLGAGGTGGRTYSRSYAGAEDPGAGKGRDSSFGRNGGGAGGRRAAREAAAADPAAAAVKRRRKMIIVFIILEIIFLLGTGLYRYAQNKISLIQPSQFKPAQVTNPNIPQGKVEEMEGYWTIALFGVDSRNNSVGKGNNADVIIICNIDQGSGEIKLVSVFRDTYLSVSDNGLYNKINQAYFLGGPKQAVEALNRNLDLQIDDFATFNWKAVVDAVNILGGVDVELSKAEFYYINAYITETVEATGVGSYQLKQAGLNHLDGVQAVAYARLRKMDTDFARTERQREIIDLCFQKLKKSDFAVVNNVMEAVFPQILSSVTIDDIIPAAKNLTKYTIADTMGFPAARSDANMGKKGACVIPQTLESNVTLLHQFLFGDENYQPSDMVKKISAKISADTGMYNEGKPIDHVGTDGGYIPKPTQATKATEETKENESESSTSETDESIIDGETDLEIETDEFGNEVDPPEDDNGIFGLPGESSGSGTVHPGRPGESSSGSMFPGAETSEGDRTTGPGAITYPGQDPARGTSAAYPGATRGTTAAYPGSQGTSAAYPGSTKGSTAAYPGASSDEYVPEGPGSVIIGPGN